MTISIVSAYVGLEDMTMDFLTNLINTTGEVKDLEVILVNAGSKPIEHPIITKRVDLDHNESFSNSMNAGIKEATGDLICVIGNDVFPKKRWLTSLIETQKNYRGFITSPVNNQTKISNYKTVNLGTGVYSAEFFPAVCWLITRKCIEEVGLFDERFKIGTYEDNDYAKRVREIGGSIIVDSNVIVKHLESQTLQTLCDVNNAMNENAKLFYEKW